MNNRKILHPESHPKYRYAQLGILVVLGASLLFFNGPHFTQPPVWDTATGLFPSAIYLAKTDFNILALLGEQSWFDAGPNTYATSPLTWMTALAYVALKTPNVVFVFLHFFQGLLTCFWGLLIHRFASNELRVFSPAIALATFAIPIVLVQTGYMYSEIGLGLLTTAALSEMSDLRTNRVSALAALSTSLKHAGIIVAGACVMFLLIRRPKHWIRDSIVIALPSLVIFGGMTLSVHHGPNSVLAAPPPYLQAMSATWHRMLMVPDLLILYSLALVIALVVVAKSITREVSNTQLLAALLTVTFTVFYLLVPAVAVSWMLPRYFVQIAPVLVFLPFTVLQKRMENRSPTLQSLVLWGGLIVLAGFLLLNAHGRFYPAFKGTAFSIVERDLSYRQLLSMQRQLAAATEGLPADVPKYVSREMYYFMTTPELGYVERRVENTTFILGENLPQSLIQCPDHFFAVISNSGHGGEVLLRIWAEARKSSSHTLRVFPIEQDGFRGAIVEFQKTTS